MSINSSITSAVPSAVAASSNSALVPACSTYVPSDPQHTFSRPLRSQQTRHWEAGEATDLFLEAKRRQDTREDIQITVPCGAQLAFRQESAKGYNTVTKEVDIEAVRKGMAILRETYLYSGWHDAYTLEERERFDNVVNDLGGAGRGNQEIISFVTRKLKDSGSAESSAGLSGRHSRWTTLPAVAAAAAVVYQAL